MEKLQREECLAFIEKYLEKKLIDESTEIIVYSYKGNVVAFEGVKLGFGWKTLESEYWDEKREMTIKSLIGHLCTN